MTAFEHAASETLQGNEDGEDLLQNALSTVRKHLGMEVAYLSEFVDGKSVFRRVDAPGLEALIKPGDSQSLEDVYCNHILEGRLPEMIPDTAEEPICQSLPITKAVPIGSHMSIPIRLANGRPYGMFCCLSPSPNKTLNPRDLDTMRVFADLAARQVNADLEEKIHRAEKQTRVSDVLNRKAFSIAYQPIVDLAVMAPAGFEALCRFAAEPYRTPDIWFGEAADAGLSVEMELAAIEMAVSVVPELNKHQYISVNASPDTVASKPFLKAFSKLPLDRIVLEITEHAQVRDYDVLMTTIDTLRRQGMRLAVDDAGAGHSSLQHIVQLKPDLVKLDISLTRNVDADIARRALVGALMVYSKETNAQIVAEGIETKEELEALRRLGVNKGQGYYLGRPAPEIVKEIAPQDQRKAG